jgi:uncharacterized membrane protein YfcA
MKGFQPSRRGAAPDCVEIMECGCQEAADRVTGPAAALTLAASTSPGLVVAGLGLPDAGLAAVALPAGLTAAFAAADVTHRLSPPSRHR